jgi:hypothetical protein
MIKYETWPPPNWTEVRVSWEYIMKSDRHNPNDMFNWACLHPGGMFHVSGYGTSEGFSYRFADSKDAVQFALRWA